MKLMLVDDNQLFASRLKRLLTDTFTVETVPTGQDALLAAAQLDWSVVLLDLRLPDIDGLIVCRRLRELGIRVPILVMTGDDRVATKVALLNNGADDYITKPFHIYELRARITALLRRPEPQLLTHDLTWYGITLDPLGHKVTRDGQALILRRKEFDILEYLMRRQGQVTSRQVLFDHVWPSTTTSTAQVVDIHIKRLREKIDKPFAIPVIKTIYGVGYRLERPPYAA